MGKPVAKSKAANRRSHALPGHKRGGEREAKVGQRLKAKPAASSGAAVDVAAGDAGCEGRSNALSGRKRGGDSEAEIGRRLQAKPAASDGAAAGAMAGDAGCEDAPAGHRAHTAVRVRSKLAYFKPRDAWGSNVPASKRQWLEEPPPVKVEAGMCNGFMEQAARVARLCFLRAEEGATLEAVRAYKLKLCKEVRQRCGKCRPPPAPGGSAAGGRGRTVAAADLPPLQLAKLPRIKEFAEGPPPPPEGVQRLYALMNSRETIARNHTEGLAGPLAYGGVPPELLAYFQRHSCPNVRRRHDRTTRDLHRLAAAAERFRLCGSDAERRHLKRLLVLNFGLWRFVGGTLAFARAVGFVSQWGAAEKEHVRGVVRAAFDDGRTDEIFCDAYESSNKLRVALKNADDAKLEAVLYNRGPKAFAGDPLLTCFTLQGKLRVLDALWEVAEEVVDAAAPDPVTGRVRWQPVVNALGRVPWFGIVEEKERVPTFFAKEVAQDLLDTPVFEGGRGSVADLRSFCPAGPGALLGLMLVYGLQRRPSQREAVPMMRALLEAATQKGGWAHGDPMGLELHDVQFMLCELQKVFHAGNAYNHVRSYAGRPPTPSLPPGERAEGAQAKPSPWLRRLEEALLLGRPECGPTPGVKQVAAAIAAWLGLPAEASGGGCRQPMLHHGDCIRLVDARQRATLFLDAGRTLRCAAACKGGKGAEETSEGDAVFLLERAAGVGPVQLGDAVFLRGPNGAHLGPAKAKVLPCRLDAVGSSERYAPSRKFWIESLMGGGSKTSKRPAVVRGGSVVQLRCEHPRVGAERAGLRLTMEARGLKPRLAGQRACCLAQGAGEAVCLELDPARGETAKRLQSTVEAAVQEGLATGRLRVAASGALVLADPEKVRRRLVGAQAAPVDGPA